MPFLAVADIGLLGFIGGLGPQEMIIIAVLGVLLFGKRLPEVGRSLGKGIVEFKRGIQGIGDEIDSAVSDVKQATHVAVDDYQETDVPKFEPPTSEPQPEKQSAEST
ncbi:MAG: Sec-independent protein translocase TatA [Planctomycetota bacterium]|nr:MAG: Sec-independent protein translocase TatA [Planctomycetota bacterium]REJ88028.1 MAG: Sec-independent protein translocase TatA [Planctomycetota bacterium]REK29949.1 MAG: Sec-independent protein translocase TatA [Planctomycetota bacterium]REK47881.1 MAG: Sec-independent protein translocase TatA [Planctomycetota bacterium]